jgi:MFS family permease
MTSTTRRGFGPVLANRDFRALWLAQLLAQTSQHAIHFIQMVLIEKLTGSAMHLALIILAFSLPGILFSAVAGVAVDRMSKKWILVGSNLIRVLLAVSYLVILNTLSGTWELVAIYVVTFLMSTLAQFFAPAEAATIPMLVGEDLLLPANSLFTLTMAISQVIGLLILGPLATSLLQVQGGFILIAFFYLGAALAVSTLPKDRPAAGQHQAAVFSWRHVWDDFSEGWHFVTTHRRIQGAMAQLVTVATLVMVMAMLAPGYAARVLGIQAENAVIVFAPAGIGMLIATGIVGRWGYRLRRVGGGVIGLVLTGLTFAAMGWVSQDYQRLLQPILHVYPRATLSLTTATMGLCLVLGMSLATVNILGQTTLQQESLANIRGRVFSVQFMLNNLVGIPPMLALGGMADAIGIPRVMEIAGLGAIAMAAVSAGLQRAPERPQRPEPALVEPPVGAAVPLPGTSSKEARS